MSNRVLISGYYGFENFGDDLIMEVIVRQLAQAGLEPVVLSAQPEQTQKLYQVQSLPRMDVPVIWKALKDAKAFISGGGGLFQDVTGPASPIYYGSLIEMANWRGVPVAMFGQGLGPINSTVSKLALRRALQNSSLVVLRDPNSQAMAHRIARVRAELAADPVWAWEPGERVRTAERQGIGISLRPWPQLKEEGIRNLASCITRIEGIKAMGVNLIDCHAGEDIVPLARLERLLKDKGIPVRWFSGANIAQGIAHSTAMLGMRFHALLVAALLDVPTVALSYDPKVEMLAAQLKIPHFPVDTLHDVTAEALLESITQIDPAAIILHRKSAQRGFEFLLQWLHGSQ